MACACDTHIVQAAPKIKGEAQSCVQGMTNRDPPLAQKYSNPGRYRLTPEGLSLGERLFAFAVESGDVPAIAGVDDAAVRARVAGQRDAQAAADAAAKPAPKRRKKAAAAEAAAAVGAHSAPAATSEPASREGAAAAPVKQVKAKAKAAPKPASTPPSLIMPRA